MSHKSFWTPQKIAQRLALIAPLAYRRKVAIPPFHYRPLASPMDKPLLNEPTDDWEVIQPETAWGKWNTNFTMRSTFQIPNEWDTTTPIALYLPLGDAWEFCHPETIIYIDGQRLAASDRGHEEVRLPTHLCDGQPHALALHGWTGGGNVVAGGVNVLLMMHPCFVVQVDILTREFITLARLALGVADHLNEHHPTQGQLYNALNAAFVVLDTRDPLGTDDFYNSVPSALAMLKAGIASAGQPMDVSMVCVGHAHIDTAWLWTTEQTVQKCARTFSTVLHLMEEYPDYKFSQSQPQLYRYTEQHYPELFQSIRERVREGRWEVMGGMWVEPDCNAIGSESLVRQFILGRAYFRQRFGDVETPVCWLPDTFGYSWALPQLIQQAGLKYFVTHKMSWNQYNQMPSQYLWWQGIDGTRILTYFLTTPAAMPNLPHATTYNGVVSVPEVFGTWELFKQKEVTREVLMPFGEGDGGGGPNRQMLDNIQQLQAFPATPQLRHGTVGEFLDGLQANAPANLPIWNGEFYLEYHRGTYTSQGRTKYDNRKCEQLLHNAEFFATLAALRTDYAYPHEQLTEAWQRLCLNHFHDILPGSSIAEVYADATKDYAGIRAIGEQIQQETFTHLAEMLPKASTLMAANTLSFGGRRIALLHELVASTLSVADKEGNRLRTQVVKEGTLVELPYAPPYSLLALTEVDLSALAVAETDLSTGQTEQGILLENAVLRVEINTAGEISRIYDKEVGREVLALDAHGNVLLAFEDRPLNFDAWDTDIFYEEHAEAVGGLTRMAIVETGTLRVTVQVERRYRQSTITQKIYLYRDSRRLDFDTWIDWHEQHTLLKVAFPVNVMNSVATFDIQWGNVQRPTHRNTSWDMARFETCAQKWVDVSEGNYGVALLNDCKYGYDVQHNVMRLTLLKSATFPDANADQGEHRMTYSLLPHTGDWRGEVVQAAYDLNNPVLIHRVKGTGETPAMSSLVQSDVAWVIIETVKMAEDGDGVIIRLYENQRNRGQFTLYFGFDVKEAYHCNLLEENSHAVSVVDNTLTLDIAPYQIMTLRLLQKS